MSDNLTHQHSDIVPNVQPGGATTVKIPDGLYVGSGVGSASSSLAPQDVYNGGYSDAKDIYLRIANGGAGQSGLIGAWANAFIQYSVKNGSKPFRVAWYLGDTTESLGLLAAGSVDIAVTYNEAAEKQSCDSGAAVDRKYGFRDHFLLVGPKSDPAGLKDEKDVLTMFNKIVSSGNADVAVPPDPKLRPPTRFLSRYDKSATNIKESELFIAIGQVPWALVYSKWYHQYPRFPLQALQAASLLSEYTLTDYGTWLSSPSSVTSALCIYKRGEDNDAKVPFISPASVLLGVNANSNDKKHLGEGGDAKDPLLNPAHVLLGAKANPNYKKYCEDFMKWVVSKDGGQKVIREFKKNGKELYTEAPTS